MPRQTTGAGGSEGPLSPLIHGRVRLLVLSHLLTEDRPLPFTQLRDHLGLTDGTLSVHLQKLEAGGIVDTQVVPPGSIQNVKFESKEGIRAIDVEGSEICVIEVCWECPALPPTPTLTGREVVVELGE